LRRGFSLVLRVAGTGNSAKSVLVWLSGGSGRYTMFLFDILPGNGCGELQNHISIRVDQA